MTIPLCSTFDYVAIVPDDRAANSAEWPVALRDPVTRTGDPWHDARLVGHAPRLRITDAGLAADPPSSTPRPFATPRVHRSRVTLSAAGRPDAGVRAVQFHLAAELTATLRPGDVLHLTRTRVSGLGVSVLRGGQLVAAAGAVSAVPLGAEVTVHTPHAVVAEVAAVLKRHDPEFTYADLFAEWPLEIRVRGRGCLRYRGRTVLDDYDVYVGHGYRPGIPGQAECVGIARRGACGPVAASASAQLLDFDDALTVIPW